MSTIVETCWGPKMIHDTPYWHITGGPFFYNNVRVGKGTLLSVSAGIEAEPHIDKAQSPYSFANLFNEKEALFEEIRRTKFPNNPSRIKTLYVFDDYSLVKRAQNEWFQNPDKTVYECRILVETVTHKADTQWLNALPNQWVVNAEKYWQGEMSESPFPEVLVHGALYFPDWQSFPEK